MSDKDLVVGKIEFATTTVPRPQTFQVTAGTSPFTRASGDLTSLPPPQQPEPSLPLSAIRALIQQWREESGSWEPGIGSGMAMCADQLEELLPSKA